MNYADLRGTVRSRRAVLRIAALLVVVLVVAATPGGASATTGPSHQRYVYLIITDRAITFHNDDLTQLTRGSYLRFFVFNQGKATHELAIDGKKTPPIKPGGRGETHWVFFGLRGRFRFYDPLHPSLFGYIQIL